MKTGRVRKDDKPDAQETTPPEQTTTSKPPVSKPPSKAYRPRSGGSGTKVRRSKPPYLILGIMAAIFICFIVFVAIMAARSGADEWVEATRVNGVWTTTVTILGPQIQIEEMWQNECTNLTNGTVRFGSCVTRDAKTYQDHVVDDYDEYAYNIYYEETVNDVFQAQGTQFSRTALGSDDWWEGNLHYTKQEELDKSSCEYTNYTIWINDPQNSSQEIEVYLSECEVWDHVVVEERVYDQKSWCQCDVTTLAEIGQQSEQGTGLNIQWANPIVPAGGQTRQAFKGNVTFLGGDYTYTTSTDEAARYQDYMTSQYHIGIRDDKPVRVSKNPKD